MDEIIARDSLRRLVTVYSRAADRRDFALLRSLYHDDAFDHHGSMFTGGADAYVVFVEKAIAAYDATVHYVVNMAFEIDGDEAEGEIHKINYHRTGGADAYEIITGSRSLDRYARRNGEWRFLSRSITLDWAHRQPVDPSAYDDFAAGSPHGRAGPDDLSYSLLTRFARQSG
ncbi:nuclear transport factor 2 family protein [Mesorhizobium sp. CAU 1741]|uniref:nuclear transport factor 2 family protein n=1 Tax=Mesorhizobium sp. CAU 1741 TaxID=3140366 RepID=UPI00325B8A5C